MFARFHKTPNGKFRKAKIIATIGAGAAIGAHKIGRWLPARLLAIHAAHNRLLAAAAFGALLAGCGGPKQVAQKPALPAVGFRPSLEMIAAVSAQAPAEAWGNWRAVSLNALSAAAQTCMPQQNCTKEVTELGGLRRVMGYIIDPQRRDVILIGYEGNNAPPLHTEDLVIALRSAWREYAVMQGNTQMFSPIGCSIDPNPQTLTKLEEVRHSIFSDGVAPDKASARFDEWYSVAAEPQSVRVLGLGRDSSSHFAKVMLDADYFMKRLVDGSAPGAIGGFTSLMDRRVAIARTEMQNEAAHVAPDSVLNRFWFTPGDIGFHQDDNIMVLTAAPVKLLTEEEALVSPTSLLGKGRADPQAKEFTENFTAQYRNIAAAWPIYAELEGLFRLVTLCEALKQKTLSQQSESLSQTEPSLSSESFQQAKWSRQSGLDISYLLKEFPVAAVAVPQSFRGIGNIREIQEVKTDDKTRSTLTLYHWSMICGGVSMQIELARSAFRTTTGSELHKTMDEVLAARPSGEAVSWSVPGAAPLAAP